MRNCVVCDSSCDTERKEEEEREKKKKMNKYSYRRSMGTTEVSGCAYPSIVVGGITVVAGAMAGAGAGKTGGPGGGRPPPAGL